MKKIIIAMFIGCLVGAAYAASVRTITIPASGASWSQGTWVNNTTPKKDVLVKSAFIQYAGNMTYLNETNTAKISKSGVTYTVDSVNITSNGAASVGVIDFNYPVYCSYGETVTVSRTATSTGTVENIMLVIE